MQKVNQRQGEKKSYPKMGLHLFDDTHTDCYTEMPVLLWQERKTENKDRNKKKPK